MQGVTRDLNSATHGDPLSAKWNIIAREDGTAVFLPTKNLHSPELADEICAETLPWLAATTGIMNAAFGQESPAPVKPN